MDQILLFVLNFYITLIQVPSSCFVTISRLYLHLSICLFVHSQTFASHWLLLFSSFFFFFLLVLLFSIKARNLITNLKIRTFWNKKNVYSRYMYRISSTGHTPGLKLLKTVSTGRSEF